jgi:hypothetical protein
MADPLVPYAPVAAAAISALVSAGVAWFTARRSVAIEIDKLKLAVQQKLLEQLVAARLGTYPELYSMISELPKAARTDISNPASLQELLDKVNAWDSKHAILLGPHTTNVCYEFRQALAKGASLASKAPTEDHAAQGHTATLFRQAELLELALRSDLGIYGVELAQAPDALRTPRVEHY